MRRRYERSYMRRSNGFTAREADIFSYLLNALIQRNPGGRKDFVETLIERARGLRDEMRLGRVLDEDLAQAYFDVMNDVLSN